MPIPAFTGRLAAWSAANARNVALGWVATLLVTFVIAGVLGGRYDAGPHLATTSGSQRANEVIRSLDSTALDETGQPSDGSPDAGYDVATMLEVLPIVAIVLVLATGAVLAGLTTLGVAAIATGVTLSIVTVMSNAWALPPFGTNLVAAVAFISTPAMSLPILARYRARRRREETDEDALAFAGETAGYVVLISGIAMLIGGLGLLLVPATMFRALALGASIPTLVAMLAALTLLPAALAMLGDGVEALALPLRRGEPANDRGFWAATTRFVMRRGPKAAIVVALPLLIVAAAGFTTRLGISGDAPTGGPTRIVVLAENVGVPDVAQAIGRLEITLDGDRDVHLVTPAVTSAKADAAVITVSLPASGDDAAEALDRLRTQIIPTVFKDSQAQVVIDGSAAGAAEFVDAIGSAWPSLLAFEVGLTIVLLLVASRSILVPIKSVAISLLCVAAAYGAVTAIVQYGWGASFLGVSRATHIEAPVPLLLIAIAFGHSTAMHVVMLMRIHDRFEVSGNHRDAVAVGLRATSSVITATSMIAIVVLGGFVLGDAAVLQQLGLGAAVAIGLDATVGRAILLPALMARGIGLRWGVPGWLRWVHEVISITDGPGQRA